MVERRFKPKRETERDSTPKDSEEQIQRQWNWEVQTKERHDGRMGCVPGEHMGCVPVCPQDSKYIWIPLVTQLSRMFPVHYFALQFCRIEHGGRWYLTSWSLTYDIGQGGEALVWNCTQLQSLLRWWTGLSESVHCEPETFTSLFSVL